MRGVADQFIDTEQGLLRSRTASSNSASQRARVTLLAAFSFVVGLKIVGGLVMSGRIARNIESVAAVAEGMAAGTFEAVTGPHCGYCPVFSSCPAQDAGRSVVEEGGR